MAAAPISNLTGREDMGRPRRPKEETKRQVELDALRTLAIALVFLVHLPQTCTPDFFHPIQELGWIGVDLFFVLSGFLIGSQIWRELALDRGFSLRSFYIRRFFRIWPAFFSVLAIYFLVPAFRERPNVTDWWRLLTFTQNFGLNAPVTFSHAWSLCVEEHFYLLIPLLALFFLKKLSLTKLLIWASLLLVLGAILRYELWSHYLAAYAKDPSLVERSFHDYWTVIYFPSYCRLDGLTIGLALATIRIRKPSLWDKILQKRALLFISSIVSMAFALWVNWDKFSTGAIVVGFPMLAFAFGCLLVVSIAYAPTKRPFWAPFVAAGAALAYSFYLTHKQIIHLDEVWFARWAGLHSPIGTMIYLLTSVAFAAAFYFVVERPFLRYREILRSRWTVRAHRSDRERGKRPIR